MDAVMEKRFEPQQPTQTTPGKSSACHSVLCPAGVTKSHKPDTYSSTTSQADFILLLNNLFKKILLLALWLLQAEVICIKFSNLYLEPGDLTHCHKKTAHFQSHKGQADD